MYIYIYHICMHIYIYVLYNIYIYICSLYILFIYVNLYAYINNIGPSIKSGQYFSFSWDVCFYIYIYIY